MKLCKDCNHFSAGYAYLPAKCWSDQFPKNPVYGGSAIECTAARTDENLCGLEARWFAPKPVKISWFKRVFG